MAGQLGLIRSSSATWWRVTLPLVVLLVAACSSTPSGAAGSPTGGYPTSMVVIGHSGSTGRATDPNWPVKDVPRNSWATGDNPTVNSIYLRILALNPAVRGHAANLAVDGTAVDQLDVQATEALRIKPLPDLFLIETLDNDIRCDGTDEQNYAPFGVSFEHALNRITRGAPRARIFVVGSPAGSVESVTQVRSKFPDFIKLAGGDGQCNTIDSVGHIRQAGISQVNAIVKGYQAELASHCAKFPRCRYDGGALSRMVVTAEDLAVDHVHLSIAGQRKQAEVEWAALDLTG
ncbi:MAG: hypothetical protein M3P18_01505 [Actinomycetota bacterium]|nr:hypothetical protein [Actinomycetota bacterium]